MRTFMRSAAVAALTMFVAIGSSGCDDVGDDGGGGVPTTSSTSTTVTTTTLSTTTTTVSSTTTTTIGGGQRQDCDVILSVPETATIGALQFNVDYSSIAGGFAGAGDQVVCNDLTGSLASFNDNEGTSTLSAGFINIAGFSAPRDVANCEFVTNSGNTTPPVPGDFTITVIDATDQNLTPITVTVEARVEACVLIGGGTTTTVPTTTVTTGSTTTTTGGTGNQFTIGFDVDGTATIGALQFSVDYSGAPGGFDGAADQVDCDDQTSSLASFNDDEGASTLAAGLINLAGFTAPRTVVTCVFTSTGTAPVPGDFTVTVEDAAAPDLSPISPLPGITVTVAPL